MPETETDFAESVLACVEDIGRFLPDLADRFHLMVIVSALAQQVGGGLQLLLSRGLCDAALARRLLRHIERRACAGGS